MFENGCYSPAPPLGDEINIGSKNEF